MADIKVEDLMRSIRERALEGAAKQTDPSLSSGDSTAKQLSRLQTSLTITGRTRDQLPPVTTYRSGLLARVELWIKRQLKRATHWYTWEQVNFNSSVDSALNNTLAILRTYEERLASYDYWQFWRNTEDADVGRFLRLFTELPLAEITKLERLEGSEVNEAKKVLATEATALCRGREAAEAAAQEAEYGMMTGQADGVEVILVGLDAGTVHLDLDNVGINAVNRGAKGLVEHDGCCPKRGTLRPDPPSTLLYGLPSRLAVTDVTR